MAEISVNHKANLGQCRRGNKQSVLFSSGWKVSDQFTKLMNPSIFPNTPKLHRSARKPYVPVLVIHAWPTFPSFPLDTREANTTACPAAELPLALMNQPSQPWHEMNCPHGKNVLDLVSTAFVLLQYGNLHYMSEHITLSSQEPNFVPPCWDQRWQLPFHKEFVEIWRVEDFLILPGQKLTTSNPSAAWSTRGRCDKQVKLLHLPWLTFNKKKLYHRHTK